MKRILKIPKSMKWGEFRKQYSKFFPISNDVKRNIKLKEEFKRLTDENNSTDTK